MHSQTTPWVIIVDPYSSGIVYAPAFAARGLHCLAVRSSASVPERFLKGFQAADFDGGMLYDADAALKHIGDAPVAAVVAGCEIGVAVAEDLAARLGLQGNSPCTTERRRHKHQMQQALALAGLRHIPTTLVRAQGEIEALLGQLNQEDNYVVKPVNSAATDGVVFARGRDGVAQALGRAAWDRINNLGEVNVGFVIQPFIQGPEYVVDMVAHAAGYTVASLSVYRKIARNGSAFVYAGLEVLDAERAEYAELIEYARQAAHALGMRQGPVHMELILSAKGPVMIEAGARLHGGVAPSLFKDCHAPDLVSLAIDAYLGVPIQTRVSCLAQAGHILFLINDRMQIFSGESRRLTDALHALPSYRGHRLFVAPGDTLAPTVDLASCPGIVWLAHPSQETLRDDVRRCETLQLVEESE
ncbi:ATP-grasp domain-containing protein [Paludibacterium yongneupense]|uniref:ATP-grasp domain-containing protein n=1 Tax=Paludibacterium yongneupense TaxID=400061 RepID=UPI0003F78285|nr:ATP-grasp domain-containing protein [Paludibacterium yongneupense]